MSFVDIGKYHTITSCLLICFYLRTYDVFPLYIHEASCFYWIWNAVR